MTSQIDLQFQDANGTILETYSSTTVQDLLLAQQSYTLTDHLPTPAQGAVANWQSDTLIASLQNLSSAIATQLNSQVDPQNTQMIEYKVAQDSLSLAQALALSTTTEMAYYTQNDVAMVSYMASGNVTPSSESNPGYLDLTQFITFLESGRNAQASLVNTSPAG